MKYIPAGILIVLAAGFWLLARPTAGGTNANTILILPAIGFGVGAFGAAVLAWLL